MFAKHSLDVEECFYLNIHISNTVYDIVVSGLSLLLLLPRSPDVQQTARSQKIATDELCEIAVVEMIVY